MQPPSSTHPTFSPICYSSRQLELSYWDEYGGADNGSAKKKGNHKPSYYRIPSHKPDLEVEPYLNLI